MRNALFLAFLFVGLGIMESSSLWLFQPSWFSAFPLLVIGGFLVLQRVGLGEGMMWFVALMLLRGEVMLFVILALAPLLITRLFTTRSVYALLGSGMTAYGAMILVTLSFHGVAQVLRLPTTWHPPFSLLLVQWVMLVPGLYVGFMLVRWFSSTVGSRVTFKPLT